VEKLGSENCLAISTIAFAFSGVHPYVGVSIFLAASCMFHICMLQALAFSQSSAPY